MKIKTHKQALVQIYNASTCLFSKTMPIATTPDEFLAGITDVEGGMIAFDIDPPNQLYFTNYSFLTGKGTEEDLQIVEINEVGQVNFIHHLPKRESNASPVKIKLQNPARYVVELPPGIIDPQAHIWELCVKITIL